jgi:hypothetical protein
MKLKELTNNYLRLGRALKNEWNLKNHELLLQLLKNSNIQSKSEMRFIT